jgi:hypothetical protein
MLRAILDQVELIESLYSSPIDIEFGIEAGKLYILQARPVTTHLALPPRLITPPKEAKALYWDVTTAVQGLLKPMSPLGTDMLNYLICGLGSTLLGKDSVQNGFDYHSPLISCEENGRIYMNVCVLGSVNNMAIVEGLLMMDSIYIPLVLELLRSPDSGYHVPPLSRVGLMRKVLWNAPIFRTHPIFVVDTNFAHNNLLDILKTYLMAKFDSDARVALQQNFHGAVTSLMARLDSDFQEIIYSYANNSLDSSPLSIQQSVIRAWQSVTDFMGANIVPCLIGLRGVLSEIESLLGGKDMPSDVAVLNLKLSQALPGNVTIDMSIELSRLAALIRAMPESTRTFLENGILPIHVLIFSL